MDSKLEFKKMRIREERKRNRETEFIIQFERMDKLDVEVLI